MTSLYDKIMGLKIGPKCCSKNEIEFADEEEFESTCLVNIGEESSDFHPDGSWMIQGSCECGECLVCTQPELPDTPRPGAKANKSEENALALSRAVEGINCPACIILRKRGRKCGCFYHDLLGFEDYYQA